VVKKKEKNNFVKGNSIGEGRTTSTWCVDLFFW